MEDKIKIGSLRPSPFAPLAVIFTLLAFLILREGSESWIIKER